MPGIRFERSWMALAGCGLLLGSAGQAPAEEKIRQLEVRPRLQWNNHFGYCGEASLIAAGMYFGQYCSQLTARRLASPGQPVESARSQLLLGVNDLRAARRMKLIAEPFPWHRQRASEDLTRWMAEQLHHGHPVLLGVFRNAACFAESIPGDEEYDHIVLVNGFGSARHPAETPDWILFADHGLYTPAGRPRQQFACRMSEFLHSRASANLAPSPPYSLKNAPANFALAIRGVADRDGATVPVRLRASLNHEPDWPEGQSRPPAPRPLQLTVTVSLPDPGETYHLYRYDNFRLVPTASFNVHANRAAQRWVIPPHSGRSFTVVYDTTTDATVVFRAVAATAP